jgi:phi13 family phage major tail protein
MAKIGIKCLTYAPYTSGGEGSAISYGTGVQLNDYMIRADVNEERADVDFYADDRKIDTENSMTGATVSLELANMTDALEKAFLGYVAESTASGADLLITDAAAGFVGVGFYRKERFKGTITYKTYWFYKVQFSKDSDSTTTKGENVDFQTESLSGDALGVTLSASGDTIYYAINRKSSESDAIAWLKTKAGISG